MGGGFRCSIIDCPNSTEKTKEVSFFRFPKDPKRAKLWLKTCGREINTPLYNLYANYRVCGAHFSPIMFLNDLKNRLHDHAYPVLNCKAVQESDLNKKNIGPEHLMDHDYFGGKKDNQSKINEKKSNDNNSMFNKVMIPRLASNNANKMSIPQNSYIILYGNQNVKAVGTENNISNRLGNEKSSNNKKDKSIQTVNKLLEDKLTNKLEILRKKLKIQQRKLRRTEEKLKKNDKINNLENDCNLIKYLKYTDKFLPPNIANFVKTQVKLNNINNESELLNKKLKKYPDELKKFCLNIYLINPKVYDLLCQQFILPKPELLKRQLKCQNKVIVENIKNYDCQN